jgi:hypothetical protein
VRKELRAVLRAELPLATGHNRSGFVGTQRSLKNCISHIDASHSRQPLVKGERLVRYEVNAVMAVVFAQWTLHFAVQKERFSGRDAVDVSITPPSRPPTCAMWMVVSHPMLMWLWAAVPCRKVGWRRHCCWQPLASRLPPKKFCYG